MNRRDFIRYIAAKNNMTYKDARKACNAVVSGIRSAVCEGYELSLRGFGRFCLQIHKGHPTQFKSEEEPMPDYLVFKFTPSHAMNRNIRSMASSDTVSAGSDAGETVEV